MRSLLSSPELILRGGLKELSLSFTGKQVTAFMTYLSELKKWNKAYSLTSLRTDEDIVVKHFLDSLLYLKAMPEGECSVADVGSGAGFPGIPMKIIRPGIMLYLVEPSKKKANFLLHMIRTLGLERVELLEKRIEEIRSLTVEVAVTRALFDLKDFSDKAFPLLREEGRLIVSKGPKVGEELRAIEEMDYEVMTFTLPLSGIKRFIVVIRKGDLSTGRANPKSIRPARDVIAACINADCRLRKAGCKGFEGCPGFKSGT